MALIKRKFKRHFDERPLSHINRFGETREVQYADALAKVEITLFNAPVEVQQRAADFAFLIIQEQMDGREPPAGNDVEGWHRLLEEGGML